MPTSAPDDEDTSASVDTMLNIAGAGVAEGTCSAHIGLLVGLGISRCQQDVGEDQQHSALDNIDQHSNNLPSRGV